jgi:hypothetical protein
MTPRCVTENACLEERILARLRNCHPGEWFYARDMRVALGRDIPFKIEHEMDYGLWLSYISFSKPDVIRRRQGQRNKMQYMIARSLD